MLLRAGLAGTVPAWKLEDRSVLRGKFNHSFVSLYNATNHHKKLTNQQTDEVQVQYSQIC